MVDKVGQQGIPSVVENQAAPTGMLTTDNKTVPVKVVSGTNEQTLRVMIVQPPAKPEGWTWGQIAKYSAYAVGAGAIVYYGRTQLWGLLTDTFPLLKTASTVVTKGIPVVGNAIQTSVDASQKLYHGLGQGVAATRGVLNQMGVQTPPIPTERAEMVALGTSVANIGLVGAATGAANAAYLAPVAAASVLAFGKPGKMTGYAALGAILGEAARPGTVKEIGDQVEVVVQGAQDACRAWPQGCTVAMSTVGTVVGGLAFQSAHSVLGGPGLALAGTAAAVVAKEIVDPGTLKEAAKAGKEFVEKATPHVKNLLGMATNATRDAAPHVENLLTKMQNMTNDAKPQLDKAVAEARKVKSGLVKAYETWPWGFHAAGLTVLAVNILTPVCSYIKNTFLSLGNKIKSNKLNTAVVLTGVAVPVVEFFAPGALQAAAETGKEAQKGATQLLTDMVKGSRAAVEASPRLKKYLGSVYSDTQPEITGFFGEMRGEMRTEEFLSGPTRWKNFYTDIVGKVQSVVNNTRLYLNTLSVSPPAGMGV